MTKTARDIADGIMELMPPEDAEWKYQVRARKAIEAVLIAYGNARERAVWERAAAVAETHYWPNPNSQTVYGTLAAAYRALASKEPTP